MSNERKKQKHSHVFVRSSTWSRDHDQHVVWFNFGSADWDSQDFSKGEDDRVLAQDKLQIHLNALLG
jgi:hypothetical protein